MKIFVSSTLIDLREHRAAVIEGLRRLGCDVVNMEIFGARPDEPTSACLDAVDDSDVFVGIYAHRYGFIRPGDNISITEVEFRRARARRIAVLCFIVDETCDWPTQHVDPEPARSRLLNLKNELRLSLVADSFTSPDDLATKAVASVARHMQRNDQRWPHGVLETLLTNLAAQVVDAARNKEGLAADSDFKQNAVFLLESVMACHNAYMKYRQDRTEVALERWSAKVNVLVEILDRMRLTLATFWPDVFKEVHAYAAYEALPAERELQRFRIAAAIGKLGTAGTGLRLLGEMAALRDEDDPRVWEALRFDYALHEEYRERLDELAGASTALAEALSEPSVWTTARRLRELLRAVMSPSEILAAQRAYKAEFTDSA